MTEPKEYPRVIFRIDSQLDTALVERCDGSSASKSSTAKRDLQRYYDALERSLPTFSMDETLTLCSCLNGVRCTPGTLYGNIAVSDELEANVFNIDTSDLLDAINNLSWVQAQAVIDAVERVWNGPAYNVDLKKRILLAGLAR